MANTNRAVSIVVALLVAGLLLAVLFPIAIGSMSGPDEATVTQDVGDTVVLSSPDLEATLDDTTDGTDATYTVSTDTDSATTTVNVGDSDTVTVDDTEVTISPSEATGSSATTTYEYPTTYGWGSGASSLWTIIPVLIVLGGLLMLVKLALDSK